MGGVDVEIPARVLGQCPGRFLKQAIDHAIITQDYIVAFIPSDLVIAGSADEGIGPSIAFDCISAAKLGIVEVGFNPAINLRYILPRGDTFHHVGAISPHIAVIAYDDIEAQCACNIIITAPPDQDIVAGLTVNGVIAAHTGSSGEDVIGPGSAVISDHHPVVAEDGIGIIGNRISNIISVNRVVTKPADQDIQADIAADSIVSAVFRINGHDAQCDIVFVAGDPAIVTDHDIIACTRCDCIAGKSSEHKVIARAAVNAILAANIGIRGEYVIVIIGIRICPYSHTTVAHDYIGAFIAINDIPGIRIPGIRSAKQEVVSLIAVNGIIATIGRIIKVRWISFVNGSHILTGSDPFYHVAGITLDICVIAHKDIIT